MSKDTVPNPVGLATELAIAGLDNQKNRVMPEEVPAFLRSMHATLLDLAHATGTEPVAATREDDAEEFVAAVSARKSLASKDHIISLVDQKPYRKLRRHYRRMVSRRTSIAHDTILNPTIRWLLRGTRFSDARWRRRSGLADSAAPASSAPSYRDDASCTHCVPV